MRWCTEGGSVSVALRSGSSGRLRTLQTTNVAMAVMRAKISGAIIRMIFPTSSLALFNLKIKFLKKIIKIWYKNTYVMRPICWNISVRLRLSLQFPSFHFEYPSAATTIWNIPWARVPVTATTRMIIISARVAPKNTDSNLTSKHFVLLPGRPLAVKLGNNGVSRPHIPYNNEITLGRSKNAVKNSRYPSKN